MDSRYLISAQLPDDSDIISPLLLSTQHSNATILAQLNLPSHFLDNSLLIKREKERIASLQHTIDRSDAISTITISTLEKFSNQLHSLEQLLTPMVNETHGIITAQRNIDQSLREVHTILDNLELIQPKSALLTASTAQPGQVLTLATASLSSTALQDRLSTDFKEFMHYLLQLVDSYKYWTIRNTYTGADRILKRIADIIHTCEGHIQTEYEKVLALSSKPVDISRLGWPLPSKFEWVADTVIERLSTMAHGMVTVQFSGFFGKKSNEHESALNTCFPLHVLVQHRAPFLKQTYKLLLREHSATTQRNLGQTILHGGKRKKRKKQSQFYAVAEQSTTGLQPQSHIGQPVQNETVTTTTSEVSQESDQIGRYSKGTHQVIFLTDVLLGILELELHLWEQIFQDCDGLEQEEIDTAFCTVISPTLTSFSKVIEEFLTTSSANKLLFTLDVLGHFQRLQPRFRAVLKKGLDQTDSFSIFMQLKSKVTYAIQSSLLEHIINSVKISKFDRMTRRDGSVADVTVETVTFLRALCTYDSVLDCLPPDVAYVACTKPFITDNSQFTKEQLKNIPSLEVVVDLNKRLSAEARIKYEQDHRGLSTGFVWKSVLPLGILPGLVGTHGVCTVSQGVVWDILQGLDATLQVRSEALKKVELQWLFYLNNYHHIAQAATKHYFRVHPLFLSYFINKTQRSKILYQTHTFKELLEFLDTDNYDPKIEKPDKKTGGLSSVYCKLIKSKFAGFNKTFTELYRNQRTFAVPDTDLRGQLRSESIDIVIPLFVKFMDKYAKLPFSIKNMDKYIKYRPDLLETLLNKFFDELA